MQDSTTGSTHTLMCDEREKDIIDEINLRIKNIDLRRVKWPDISNSSSRVIVRGNRGIVNKEDKRLWGLLCQLEKELDSFQVDESTEDDIICLQMHTENLYRIAYAIFWSNIREQSNLGNKEYVGINEKGKIFYSASHRSINRGLHKREQI